MADDDVRARRTAKAAGSVRKTASKKAATTRAAPVKKAAPAAKKAGGTAKAAVRKVATAAKAPGRKAPAPKAPARKAPVRKASPRASAAERTSSRAAESAKASSRLLTPRPPKAPSLRLAAEQTFADDLPPAAAPARERDDPSARVRAALRAAAVSLGQRDATEAAPPPPPPPPVPEEPAPRVLVAPLVEEPDPGTDIEWEIVDDEEFEEQFEDQDTVEDDVDAFGGAQVVEGDEEEEWSPPEVLEEEPAPSGSRRLLVTTPPTEAAAPPPPPPPSPPPPPPPAEAPAPPVRAEPAERAGRAGAGVPVLAIVLALVVPVIGAIVGLVLANGARRKGAALAGLARVVSVLALVAWLVGAAVVGFVTWRDQGIDYSKLKVGDCFDSTASNEVRGIKVKSCDEPHNSEIFFIVQHPAGTDEPYPGKDALVQYAADACLGQPLTDYLGVPLEQSTLKDFEIVPQESAWEDGRRLLVCGLDTGGQGDITGSVKGTRR